jgi:hypothetical protein
MMQAGTPGGGGEAGSNISRCHVDPHVITKSWNALMVLKRFKQGHMQTPIYSVPSCRCIKVRNPTESLDLQKGSKSRKTGSAPL